MANPAREGKPLPNRNSKEGNPRYDRLGGSSSERCSLSAVASSVLSGAIQAATDNGDLISFGSTSDGGAWVVSVFSMGKRYPQYAHSAEELDHALQEIIDSSK